ncbi:MAG: AsmA-like C-terminal domain-containing protein [Elusimicrobia bacterium]|nr:AsmA-like C-terminal domain-containing protein [Elusimicrobiota bacterium]
MSTISLKPVFRKVFAPFVVAVAAFAIAAVFFFLAVNFFLKPYILSKLSGYLKSEVNCSFIWFRFDDGFRAVCRNVSARNRFGKFLSAELAVVPIDLSGVRQREISFGKILIVNSVIRVEKMKKGFNISDLLASVSKSSGKKPKIKLRVSAISFVKSEIYFGKGTSGEMMHFSSADFNILLNQPGTKIFFTSAYGRKPFTVVAHRLIDWRISARNKNIPVSRILDIFDIKAKIEGFVDVDMVYKGNFSKKNVLNGNVFLRDFKTGLISGSGQIFVKENKFFAELSGSDGKFSASGIFNAGTFLFQNAFLKLPEVSAEFAGSLSGDEFSVEGQFEDLKMKNKLFSGVLSGEIRASGSLLRLNKVSADLAITAAEGSFSKLSFLYNVLQTLDVFNFLLGKFPKYKDNFPVDRITGRVVKDASFVKISDVLVENSVSRTSVDGDIDLEKNSLDLIIGFQAQKFVNDVISKIPLVGYVLLGKTKSLIPIFVRVSGSVSKPSISPLPAKTIGGPIVGIVERTFKIPFKIFKSFGGKK